jgi:hypothetical protein
LANDQPNAFELSKDVVIREPQHQIPAGLQPSISNFVALNSRFEIVRLSVKLDHELGGMADEVDDVGPHWGLAPKPEPLDMVRFEIPPQQRLGARHRLTQCFRAVALLVRNR